MLYFTKFIKCEFDFEDKPYCGRSQKFGGDDLPILLNDDFVQSTLELFEELCQTFAEGKWFAQKLLLKQCSFFSFHCIL